MALRAVRPLPLEAAEIDAEWLSAALSTYAPGARVESFEITDARHGLTTIFFVRAELNAAAREAGLPSQFVLKGGFEPYSRERARSYCMEAVGYRDVWPRIGMNRPHCYFADAEPERKQAVVIMEDMTLRGVRFGHGLKPHTPEQMKRRLSSLAAIHAKTWDSPDLRAGGAFEAIHTNGAYLAYLYMEQEGYLTPEGWETLLSWPQSAAGSTHFQDQAYCARAMRYLSDLSGKIPNCIIHGDPHLGNLFEEADGTPGFFDSIPRRDPPHFELAYIVTCGLDPKDRRECEDELVKHYVRELEANGVRYSSEDMRYYYALFLHQGYMWFVFNESRFQTPAFNTANLMRFSFAMIDNGTRELFEAAFSAA